MRAIGPFLKKPLIQEAMIEQVRCLCHEDTRVAVALIYGSFPQGDGDEFSDIEFYIFIEDLEFSTFAPREWIQRIMPTALCFTDDFGFVITIFDNLVRGEFVFAKAAEMATMPSLRRILSFPHTSWTSIIDSKGELEKLRLQPAMHAQRSPREKVIDSYNHFLNYFLSGLCTLARGERARSWDKLSTIHRYLLWLVRLSEDTIPGTDSRPYRNLERDISPVAYDRFIACTGSLHSNRLEAAYQATWMWSREIISQLAIRYEISLPETLIQGIDMRTAALLNLKQHI